MNTNFKNDLAPAVIELNRMNEELQAENEKLKAEQKYLRFNLDDWHNEADTMKARVKELEAENEELKRELKQTEAQDQVVIDGLRKEIAKLKCLALHLFSNYFFDCYWNSKGLDPNRYLHLHEKYEEAYRNEKKALREGRNEV